MDKEKEGKMTDLPLIVIGDGFYQCASSVHKEFGFVTVLINQYANWFYKLLKYMNKGFIFLQYVIVNFVG